MHVRKLKINKFFHVYENKSTSKCIIYIYNILYFIYLSLFISYKLGEHRGRVIEIYIPVLEVTVSHIFLSGGVRSLM